MQDYGNTGGTGGTGGTGASGYGGASGGTGGLGDESSTGGLGGGVSGAGSTGGTTGGSGYSTGGTGSGLGDGMLGSAGTDDFADAEPFYRRHYTGTAEPAETTTTYEDARTGYEAGHRAAENPTYANRTFEEVEVDVVEREYKGDRSRFAAVRGYARSAFTWKTVVGAVAVAAGGYWASKKLFQAASEIGEEEERDCRTFYEMHPSRTTITYDQARTGYALGYVASRNPEYSGRSYDDVDAHLQGGYSGRAGNYDDVRDFARRGYERGSSRANS